METCIETVCYHPPTYHRVICWSVL